VNKQHRLAYSAIKEVSQGKHGAINKLLAVVGVSRQAYYKGLKRKETAWEIRDLSLKIGCNTGLTFTTKVSALEIS
jgi:hypothetical protein